jgi:flagellar hook-basal body complex protein FliE
MRIESIPGIAPLQPTQSIQPSGSPDKMLGSFKQLLEDSVNQVNNLQTQADTLAQQMASGKADNLHEVMLALNKASLALEFTIQVRNKVIEAYQEIMRTQV